MRIWMAAGAVMAMMGMVWRRLLRAERERADLQEAATSLARRNEQLEALTNVFSQVASDMRFDQVVSASLRETARIMNADMVSLRRLEGERLVSVGAILQDGRALKLSNEVLLGLGPSGLAVAEQRTIRIDRDGELSMSPNITGPDSADGTLSPSVQSQASRLESGIVAPLIVGSKVVGVLAVWSRKVALYTEDDEAVLELMASQIATAMLASSIMEERDRQAHLDALTGLPNRLQLAEDMADELAALAPLSRRAVFAMADIDFFKGYNDQFGHSAGDMALRRIGSLLLAGIRSKDRVYRYGGEEFLIVFMDAAPEEGKRLAERLRTSLEQEISNTHPVTMSIGVAALPRNGTNPAALIELADFALYRAKSAGRNQTVVWDIGEEQASVA